MYHVHCQSLINILYANKTTQSTLERNCRGHFKLPKFPERLSKTPLVVNSSVAYLPGLVSYSLNYKKIELL